MTLKKGELNEKDIKKENANLSADQLSDVSGGKMFLEGGVAEDGTFLNPKGEDGDYLSKRGEDGRLLIPKEGGMVMNGDELSEGKEAKSHIFPKEVEARP